MAKSEQWEAWMFVHKAGRPEFDTLSETQDEAMAWASLGDLSARKGSVVKVLVSVAPSQRKTSGKARVRDAEGGAGR
jgi:hypothetical protein